MMLRYCSGRLRSAQELLFVFERSGCHLHNGCESRLNLAYVVTRNSAYIHQWPVTIALAPNSTEIINTRSADTEQCN